MSVLPSARDKTLGFVSCVARKSIVTPPCACPKGYFSGGVCIYALLFVTVACDSFMVCVCVCVCVCEREEGGERERRERRERERER